MKEIDEVFGPNEGIDTINLEILFVNFEILKDRLKRGVSLGKGITIHFNPVRINYELIPMCFLHIQNEALDMNHDIYRQLVDIVFKLYKLGICDYPFAKLLNDDKDIKNFMYLNFDHFVILKRLDFFWDFKEGYVIPKNTHYFPSSNSYSTYSHDGKAKKSHWNIYDRRLKLKSLKQISFSKIDKMKFPLRIEYRMKNGTSDYLNIKNLLGNYTMIMARFVHVIARSWKRYANELGTVYPDILNNPYFSVILYLVEQKKYIKKNLSLHRKEKNSYYYDSVYDYINQKK